MLVGLFIFLVLVSSRVWSFDPGFNDDVLGLIVFKAGLHDPFKKLESWNEEDDNPCYWDGVKCDPKLNRVTELNLKGFSLSGHIGRGLLRLEFLRVLSLANNNFSGTINPNLCRLGGLQVVDLSENNLLGSIPDDLFRQCRLLRSVSFAGNKLSGSIPDSLSSCLTLVSVNFSSNQLTGVLPFGIWSLFGLRSLDLSDNLLESEIPAGIRKSYNLRTLILRKNRFSGRIPDDIGGCYLLKWIDFGENSFSGNLPNSMQKLRSCTYLSLRGNLFMGSAPDWIGEMRSLVRLDLSGNRFSGEIPNSLGNLLSLKELNLSRNQFTGNLQDSIRNCSNLSVIDISQNKLNGDLPPWIFDMQFRSPSISESRFNGGLENPTSQSFLVLDFSSNAFSGKVPSGIGNLSSLQFLNISRNFLNGDIPNRLGELKDVYVLDLSNNLLNGSIPSSIGGAASLMELRLEKNFLSGNIPTQIGNCSSLTTLILSQNNLTGSVPLAIATLTNIQTIDLSLNSLTGSLPKQLTNLTHLIAFNVSHNHLEGELPVGGFFNTIPLSSISDNPSLCGSVVNLSCPSVHPKPIVLNPNSSSDSGPGALSPNNRHRIILSISSLIAIGAAVVIAIGVLTVTLLNIHVRSNMLRANEANPSPGGDDFSCSPASDSNFGKLYMFSDDSEFSSSAHALLNKDCEIGRGGFGVVYRTNLKDGRLVAIKKLNVAGLTKCQEEFEAKVKKFGKIKHLNLVVLDGYYWTQSLQLLIYEYVSNGSLYKHLHENSGEKILSWRERFNIILGMAKGLSYLHRCDMIHYNLKSTNVLINDSGDAKIGDFGLANLLPMLDRYVLSSKVQSALGYTAPEFACKTVKVTEKCDVYGFGILVLEIVTGKRPVEYMEDDVVVLCDMVREALDESRVEECVDGRLQHNFPAEEAIPVIKLGLVCASQVPSNRPDMGEVVNILELIQCPSEGREELE